MLLSPRLRRVVELKPLSLWGQDSRTVDDRLQPSLLCWPTSTNSSNYLTTCTWWLFLQGRRQEKDKKGWRCYGVKKETATERGEGAEGCWRRVAQPFWKSRVSRSPGVWKDSRLERTFLPQLVLLTGQQSGQGARPTLTGLWAPSPHGYGVQHCLPSPRTLFPFLPPLRKLLSPRPWEASQVGGPPGAPRPSPSFNLATISAARMLTKASGRFRSCL